MEKSIRIQHYVTMCKSYNNELSRLKHMINFLCGDTLNVIVN